MTDCKHPAENRLRKRSDFIKLHLEGKRYACAILAMSILPAGTEHTRLGLVVSKKISKKAVIRNRIKRRLREAFRKLRAEILSPHDIVFIARPKITGSDYQDTFGAVKKLLNEAGLRVDD